MHKDIDQSKLQAAFPLFILSCNNKEINEAVSTADSFVYLIWTILHRMSFLMQPPKDLCLLLGSFCLLGKCVNHYTMELQVIWSKVWDSNGSVSESYDLPLPNLAFVALLAWRYMTYVHEHELLHRPRCSTIRLCAGIIWDHFMKLQWKLLFIHLWWKIFFD